ncbi:MAG: Elongation factor 4 [Candidatus Nomurabacteria bacterium GW2011_GWA1_46_11]|uniref:Elongation factor 4 n=2 Tax=Parcubacteria group TaxID=1794811 RepID=A0A1G1YUX2_9BACT|nr:MAG: Elongation factor 4 [Parcubacteria group bacterium GW2011_GWA2_46_10]KKU21893.1 MAG: Elongation factor 4 [Candidatus Nomurabacteria bacterium GW2011_GWA1_46_11]OGY56173.1 MAG: elongation factor 4 [Candidatus Colwellbacteria bacterium GWA2_46_10]
MESRIRNFVIIAHIDHGKSTLADRFLEITGTVSARDMKEQYLDSMELERERGITIKMAPVRMEWKGVELNLIDTPGHSDFSYEVSRALKAVEGAILLVDVTQGIQAQTLANLEMARQSGLKVVGALNKVDMNPPGVEELRGELAKLIGVEPQEIHRISAKTGQGVEGLLDSVVSDVPAPKSGKEMEALIFSSLYDEHKGIIAFVRVFGGEFRKDQRTKLQAVGENFKVKEVGFFAPQLEVMESLKTGEIGYIATGVKDPDRILIGDTIGERGLPGFKLPKPVVFVSLYPDEGGDYDDLKVALDKLHLNDSALEFTPDSSQVLGRGFKCGFLGRLHFEITMQRLEREFGLATVNSFPSVAYKVIKRGGREEIVENARDFPDDPEKALEPIVKLNVLTPSEYLGSVLGLNKFYRMRDVQTGNAGRNIKVEARLPLAELIMDFDDKLKSVSKGFASFSYEPVGYEEAELRRLDIYIAGELVPGLSRVVYKEDVEREGRRMTEKLRDLLPKVQFVQALQAKVGGTIVARENVKALRKDVTGALYGGDITRKKKLLEKQKKGKKKLVGMSRVSVPPEVFRELLKR